MILLCFSYLPAHTVVSKLRRLQNLIIWKSCKARIHNRHAFKHKHVPHIHTFGHLYHTYVNMSQIQSALTLAQTAPTASFHSTQCLIMSKVWQWERPMHTCMYLHMHNVDPSWIWAEALNLSIAFSWIQIFPVVTHGQMSHWDPKASSVAGTDLSHFHTHTHSICWCSDPHRHIWVENGR